MKEKNLDKIIWFGVVKIKIREWVSPLSGPEWQTGQQAGLDGGEAEGHCSKLWSHLPPLPSWVQEELLLE